MPSNKYPDGKLQGTDDEGALAVALYTRDGRLVIDFGKMLAWVAMNKEGLRSFIDALEDKYKSL